MGDKVSELEKEVEELKKMCFELNIHISNIKHYLFDVANNQYMNLGTLYMHELRRMDEEFERKYPQIKRS